MGTRKKRTSLTLSVSLHFIDEHDTKDGEDEGIDGFEPAHFEGATGIRAIGNVLIIALQRLQCYIVLSANLHNRTI